jgi:hypothetical protein
VFDISSPDGREHFLLGNILGFIERSGSSAGQEGFVDASRLHQFAQGLGFNPSQVNFAVRRAIEKKLIDPSPAFLEKAEVVAYRITTIGAYTIKRLCTHFQYVDAMVVDTPIVDEAARLELGGTDDIDQRLGRATRFVDYLDSQWQTVGNKSVTWDWAGISNSVREQIVSIQRKRQYAREAMVRPTRPVQ